MNSHLGDIYATATALSWAIAVIFFKLSTANLRTIPLKIVQNLVAVILLYTTLAFSADPWWPQLSSDDWVKVTLSALLGISLGDTLYMGAIKRIGASLQAIIDGLYMPFVLLLAYWIFAEQVPIQVLIGAALVIGAIVLAHLDSLNLAIKRTDLIVGITFAVLSQLAMAFCVVLVKDVLHKESILTLTAFRFLFGTILLGLGASWGRDHTRHWDWAALRKSWLTILAGAVFGPFLATLFWFAGFKYTLAGKAAVYNQLSTILIILFAAWFLKERLTRVRVLAVIIAIAGGALVFAS